MMGWESDFIPGQFPVSKSATNIMNGNLASSSIPAEIGAAQNYICVSAPGASSFVSTLITGATSDTVSAGSSDPKFNLRVPPFVTEVGLCVFGYGTVGRVDSAVTFKCTPSSTEFTTSTGPMSALDATWGGTVAANPGPQWFYLTISGGGKVDGDDNVGSTLIVNESQTDQWTERLVTMVLDSQAAVASAYYFFIPPKTMTVP